MANESADNTVKVKGSVFTNSGFVFIFSVLISYPLVMLISLLNGIIPFEIQYVMSSVLPYLFQTTAIFLFVRWYKIKGIMAFKRPGIPSLLLMIPLIAFIYPFVLFLSALVSYLFPSGTLNLSDSSVNSIKNLGIVGAIVLLAVVPAVFEELLCRGFIYGIFRNRSFISALLVSSISFALLHRNVEQAVYTFLFGMVLCVVREMTGSVFPGMLAHMLFNGISVISMFRNDRVPDSNVYIEKATEITIAQNVDFGYFWFSHIHLFIISMLGLSLAVIMFMLLKKFNGFKGDLSADKTVPAVSVTYVIGWVLCVVLGFLLK